MNIFVMNLEPIDTRYTGQWAEGLPVEIERAARAKGIRVTNRWANNIEFQDLTVSPMPGEPRNLSGATTAGAFLNFAETNLWKNEQMHDLTRFFRDGLVKPGDKVLFPDAWHPGVIQTKYMSELLDIPVEIHVMWHAGSYDPQDFLGRKVQDKRWSLAFERSVLYAADFNYFATHFHAGMFENTVLERYDNSVDPRVVISGQPHSALVEALEPFRGQAKKRQILFPHRVAPEKQPEIFRDLARHMPDVTFVVAQDTKLTKDEYHELLAESAIVFSANLQETLGISSMEAVLVGSQPYVPWRLSYREMYQQEFTYPPDWSIDYSMYELFRPSMIKDLYERLDHPERYTEALEYQREILLRDYLSCEPMLERLLAR
jgi:glycosyltransferase involved in cell wall biosynthesis